MADSAPKIYVDDDFNATTPGWGSSHFDQIQHAIDNASSGNRIIVYEGIYYENILIDKTVDLFGEDGGTTLLDGGGEGSVITITASNVDLSTFTIQNSGTNKTDAAVHISSGSGNIVENTITDCSCGIYVDECDNNIIAQNDITSTVNATYLISSNENIIEYNSFYENENLGIFLNGSCADNVVRKNTVYENGHYAVYLNDICEDNQISENTIYGNDDTGIRIEDDVANTSIVDNELVENGNYGIFVVGFDSFVSENIVEDNGKHGIFLFADTESTVTKNKVTSNGLDGIRLQNSTRDIISENRITENNRHGMYLNYYSLHNQIFNNYFSSNQLNAKDISPEDSQNQWYHSNISSQNIIYGPIIAGNYWDDYTGMDENRDGVGDTSYSIEGSDKTDERPIVYRRPLADTGGPYSGSVFENIVFDASESSDVNQSVNLSSFTWEFEDGYTATGEIIERLFESSGNYSVELTVENEYGGNDTDSTYVIVTPDELAPTIEISTQELVVTEDSTLFTIKSIVTDNVEVENVTLSYWMDNESNIQTVVMNQKSEKVFEKTVVLSKAYDDFYCIVNATDVSGNNADTTSPFAVFSSDPVVNVSESVEFDASDSFDLDGEIISYQWDFGNGITKNGIIINYEFSADGTYDVVLTVTDDEGNSGECKQTIQVLPARPLNASSETLVVINNKDILSRPLTDPFVCYDTDGNGDVDMFVDPNGEINLVSVINLDDEVTFLLSVDDTVVPEFFWQPESDTIEFISLVIPTVSESNVVINYQSEEATLRIEVDKSGWIWIDIKDTVYPDADLKKIRDVTNGRDISPELIWRKNDHIYVLDDPSTEYDIIFEDVLPEIEVDFHPADSGVIDEFQQTITISYNVPVSVFYASFNNIEVTNELKTSDNKTFTYNPPGYWANGTYTFIIDVEAVHGSKSSSDAATYFYFQYELPPQPSFVEKYGLMMVLVGLVLGGGLFYGICRFKGISFDSYVYVKNRRLFPFIKPVIFGPMSVTVEKQNVSKAEFYVDGVLKETLADEPFVWQWNEPGFLNHSVEAKVFDTNGKTVSSGEMNVFIINPFRYNADLDDEFLEQKNK
ncbi:MAG TPA: NosD domain-containing protein [Candidatus Thermoplasmatota archaeon]|nr:NosD domain-containing protein [Candidatus Thermoplasmatota archaeon]